MTHGIHGEKRWYALIVLCLGVLMIVLDSTIVNVALPSISTDLHFTETALVWVVNAYLLTFGGCLLLGGRLGDLYGQRRMFLAGLVVFTLASLACGLAQSQTMLIAARAVQGLGGAVVSAVSLSLIMNLFTEPGERARAMGVYGFVCAGGGSIGVLLGGLLTSSLSWHWIFLVNLPIGIAVYAMCAALLRKVNATELAPDLAARFGAPVRRDPEQLVRALGSAVEAYLQSDEMAPFTSRFDAFLRTRKPLAPAEMRGLALFRNPDKGNCMSCHTLSETSSRPERSLFTDFGYDAIAVPRNRALPANRDPRHFDNGLCDTARRLRWPEPTQWCGYLRTPGLRNVAVKQTFMHNGVFTTLRDAVAFYNTRSTDPGFWYHGAKTFDDVPAAYRGNINVNSTPMNRRPGTPPALSEAEIDDIVAFLGTLTDARYTGIAVPAAARATGSPDRRTTAAAR
ncbi:MFS transporter [Burkholderia stabilis]